MKVRRPLRKTSACFERNPRRSTIAPRRITRAPHLDRPLLWQGPPRRPIQAAGRARRSRPGRASLSRTSTASSASLRMPRRAAPSVAFAINRAGAVVSARLISSSGDHALDEEAVALLHRASPVPAPPPQLSAGVITLTVPINSIAKFRSRPRTGDQRDFATQRVQPRTLRARPASISRAA